jgi:HTH-type transcriptional regulator/antitoxin HipB
MIVRTPSDLGLLIRARRKKLGLDQHALAKKAGVSRLWIIEFEKGKPRAESGLVMRTLLALDLELDVSTKPEAAPVKRRAGAASIPDIDAIVKKARVQR